MTKPARKQVKRAKMDPKIDWDSDEYDATHDTLFVFYTFCEGRAETQWTYKLPKGWYGVGAGSTESVFVKPTLLSYLFPPKPVKYLREEQFSGPKGTAPLARAHLQRMFDDLKRRGVIKCFKIRRTFSP
jgi:hypothetical protein